MTRNCSTKTLLSLLNLKLYVGTLLNLLTYQNGRWKSERGSVLDEYLNCVDNVGHEHPSMNGLLHYVFEGRPGGSLNRLCLNTVHIVYTKTDFWLDSMVLLVEPRNCISAPYRKTEIPTICSHAVPSSQAERQKNAPGSKCKAFFRHKSITKGL